MMMEILEKDKTEVRSVIGKRLRTMIKTLPQHVKADIFNMIHNQSTKDYACYGKSYVELQFVNHELSAITLDAINIKDNTSKRFMLLIS
jgi:uncharacterized CHY-type Zn-finger protein